MNQDKPLLRLVVNDLGTKVKMRTFDMSAEAFLGGVYVQYLKVNTGKLLKLTSVFKSIIYIFDLLIEL